jgi:glyoxylase I family protein
MSKITTIAILLPFVLLLWTRNSSNPTIKKALMLEVLSRTDLNEIAARPDTNTQKKSNDQVTSLKKKPRLEHLAFNVNDPAAVAKWYCDHLGMKVVRKSLPPSNTHFIGDAGGNMLLELYNNPGAPVPNHDSLSHMALHLAFMVNEVKAICDSLMAAGAKLVEDTVITTGIRS